ncbi:MAG: PEP-CTERM system histidine kinase PrsK [Deltaproteobacteria bacterium]|nr:PEP-CTERM system histidine kinase PrsK [Deltaproteobacteria bacterium]
MLIFYSFISFAAALLCASLGILFLVKDRRSFVHRTFFLGTTALALEQGFMGLAFLDGLALDGFHWLLLKYIASSLVPGAWFFFSLSFAKANYQDIVQRWKWRGLVACALPIILVTVFQHDLFVLPSSGYPSRPVIQLGWSAKLLHIYFLLLSVVILTLLEGTFRASTGDKRWRIKFTILGIASIFAARIYATSQELLFGAEIPDVEAINALAGIFASVLFSVSLARNRVMHLDLHVSQALLWNSLTLLVTGVYLLGAGLLARAIQISGGARILPVGTLLMFLALVALGVLLMSDQLRQRAKRLLTRHMQRPHYDYRNIWTTFTSRTSSLLRMEELCAAVVKMVSETFGVPDVSIWLMNGSLNQLKLAGSTSMSPLQAGQVFGYVPMELAIFMEEQSFPVDFENSSNTKANALKEQHGQFFRGASARYCVALASGRKWVGLMFLGDRLTGESFSFEDLDLLQTLGDHAAASVLNLTLAQELMQAKQLEAFQTVSAFFTHDLKNLASSLSLSLQNLNTYYNDPGFRADLLRSISKSVEKINSMCGRVSSLRQGATLKRSEVNLNKIIKSTLAELNGRLKASLNENLGPLPKIAVDQEEIQKVVVNLLLNAQEAVGSDGEIRVSTEQQNGWIILSVRDNGCGMSKEFISNSLFRPFQTTKNRGMGIGLFQSRRIVESHRGKIEVESEEGKGTTFRVLLPVKDTTERV